jgi:hypothetical protein
MSRGLSGQAGAGCALRLGICGCEPISSVVACDQEGGDEG